MCYNGTMIDRKAREQIKNLAESFRVTVVSGPRQSGKTTLIKDQFDAYKYYNLEDLDTLDLIQADPMGFVRSNTKVIIDEVQRLPEILSAIQVVVDERQLTGDYVLSGSQNLLLSEKIGQSLAGRAAYQTLLPLSIGELIRADIAESDFSYQIWKGFYPALYATEVDPSLYYSQYLATYVERDVRAVKNVQDLGLFRKFITLLAGRIGQLVNYESLANDTGITTATVEKWLSILEASYLIYRLKPYHANINKRLVKSAKVYFIDTGLASHLLGVRTPHDVETHYLRGGLFENMVITDIKKQILNSSNLNGEMYFYRDSNNKEVDLVIDLGSNALLPVEIKSSSRPASSFVDNLESFRQAMDKKDNISILAGHVIYAGFGRHEVRGVQYRSWADFSLDEII